MTVAVTERIRMHVQYLQYVTRAVRVLKIVASSSF